MATTQEQAMIDIYTKLKPDASMLAQIRPYIPSPKDKDYEFGELNRYFAQQTNQKYGEIIEISKQTYKTLRNESLYIAVEIRWKIAGLSTDAYDLAGRLVRPGIVTANNAAITRAAKMMPAIKQKLTNPYRFWRGF